MCILSSEVEEGLLKGRGGYTDMMAGKEGFPFSPGKEERWLEGRDTDDGADQLA